MDLSTQLEKEQQQLQILLKEAAFMERQLRDLQDASQRQAGVVQTLAALTHENQTKE